MPTTETCLWRGVWHSTRGASHLRKGLPNQDAIALIYGEDDGCIHGLAISDGHGNAKAFRSDYGSSLAVRLATELCISALRQVTDGATQRSIREWLEDDFPKLMARRWTDAVLQDFTLRPPDDAELERPRFTLDASVVDSLLKSPISIYGATLIVVFWVGDLLFLAQLGDGDLLVVMDDGATFEPVPHDARNFANATTSLSLPDAAESFRTEFLQVADRVPALILASSDGWRNSFADDAGFLRVGPDILDDVRAHTLLEIADRLEIWLANATASGSGDDITLGMLVRSDVVASAVHAGAPDRTEGADDALTLTMCPSCRSGVPAGASYCEWCGAPLGDQQVSSTPTDAERPVPPPGSNPRSHRWRWLLAIVFIVVLCVVAASVALVLTMHRPTVLPVFRPASGRHAAHAASKSADASKSAEASSARSTTATASGTATP